MTDAQAVALLAPLEREADEWRAVEAIEIDESDFVPEILPEEISDVFERLVARPSTDVSGWTIEEERA